MSGLSYFVEELGFDRSRPASRGTGQPALGSYVVIGCSQCQAAVIAGVSCHEKSCPNARHFCKGCDSRIPARALYCDRCLR